MKQIYLLCCLILFFIVINKSSILINCINSDRIVKNESKTHSNVSFIETKNIKLSPGFKNSAKISNIKKESIKLRLKNIKSQNFTQSIENTIYLPLAKKDEVMVRLSLPIAFYANLQMVWMKKYRNCKNKDLYYESLLKYIMYFNSEKLSNLKLQFKKILSLFERFKSKKDNDDAETLTMKYFSSVADESSQKSTAFFGVDKIYEHMKFSRMPNSLLKRYAMKRDFLSYSMNKKRMENMLKFVLMTAKFIINNEKVNLIVSNETYTKLRFSLLKLIHSLRMRNKKKGIKNLKMYRKFLRDKFLMKKSINLNKNYIKKQEKFSKKNIRNVQFVDLSNLDMSPGYLDKARLKTDEDKKAVKKLSRKINFSQSKGNSNSNKNKNKTTLIRKSKLNKSFLKNNLLVDLLIIKIGRLLNKIVSKVKLSEKKGRKIKKINFNKIQKKKTSKRVYSEIMKENTENLETNDEENTLKSDKINKINLASNGQPYLVDNLKLRNFYLRLLDVKKKLKNDKSFYNKVQIKNNFSLIRSKVAKMYTLINNLSDIETKNKLKNKLQQIYEFLKDPLKRKLKIEDKKPKGKKNLNKSECEKKSRRLLEDYDFYNSYNKESSLSDSEKYGLSISISKKHKNKLYEKYTKEKEKRLKRLKSEEENSFKGLFNNSTFIGSVNFKSWEEKRKNERVLKEMYALIQETFRFSEPEKSERDSKLQLNKKNKKK